MILETKRLTIRRFDFGDAEFILRLLNEPSFIENVADKGVRDLEGAKRYLRDGPVASYARYGFGLWKVGLKSNQHAIGMAGILKRENLDNVDLGYAFLPEYCGQGYALEATSAVLNYARVQLGYGKVVAVVGGGNERSIRLLGKLGFEYEQMARLSDGDDELMLFASVGETL